MRRQPLVHNGAVTGGVRLILRLEGLALLAIGVLLYARQEASWWLFCLLFFAPDVSFVGYLAGNRAGALLYNLVHTTFLPILLGIAAIILGLPGLHPIALIWLAHIGFDRALGYGLKYPAGFGFTHLGLIGNAARGNLNPDGPTAA